MRRSVLVASAVASVAALALHGAGVLGTVSGHVEVGPPAGHAPLAERVLVVSIPRLTWEDIEVLVEETCAVKATPSCYWAEGLGDVGATNSLRAIGPQTSLPEGYTTLGAGNRGTIPVVAARDATRTIDGGFVHRGVAAVIADADGKLYGAEPGALGEALHGGGLSTSVVSSSADALLALMDRSGRVDGGDIGQLDDAAAAEEGLVQLESHDAVLVELSQLDQVVSAHPHNPERMDTVRLAVESAFRLVAAAPPDTLMMVLTPAPPRNRGQLGVFAMQGATTGPSTGTGTPGSVFQSPTTRRVGYVTLTDVAPTILSRLGIEVPSAMNGTPIVSTPEFSSVQDMAEIDRVSRYRDALVGPISVIYVVLQVLAAGVALWSIRRSRRLETPALVMACTVVVVPALAFLSGAMPYHLLPKAVYAVGLFVVSAIVGWLALRWATMRQRPAWHAVLALVAVALAVQWVDITTGGRLQINTPFGYSPIIAGRFQGYGNLSFSMASTAALIVASAAMLARPKLDRFEASVWAATVGAIMVVCDGMPAFGADVGGVLALIPAFIVLVTIVSGRRMSVLRLALAGAAGVVVLVAFAAFDLSRPEEQRTHLGRFVARMLDGEAGVIIRRKINANIGILTSSVWTWLVPVIVVFFVLIARRRDGIISHLSESVPGVRAFLASSLVLAVVGFAVNDSGVAIPAAMAGLVLPWVTALALAFPRGTLLPVGGGEDGIPPEPQPEE